MHNEDRTSVILFFTFYDSLKVSTKFIEKARKNN